MPIVIAKDDHINSIAITSVIVAEPEPESIIVQESIIEPIIQESILPDNIITTKPIIVEPIIIEPIQYKPTIFEEPVIIPEAELEAIIAGLEDEPEDETPFLDIIDIITDNEIEPLELLEKDDYYWSVIEDVKVKYEEGELLYILEARDILMAEGYLAISGKFDYVALLGFYSDCGCKPVTVGIWDKYLKMNFGRPGLPVLPPILDPKEWLDALKDFFKDILDFVLPENWEWWLIGIIAAIIIILILFFVGKTYLGAKIVAKAQSRV